MSSNTANKMQINIERHVWNKYVYTAVMCIIHTAFGINNSVFGPAFVDFKYTLNTSMNRIALIPTFMTLGYITGSLFVFLYKYLNRQITIVILLISMGINAALTPYSVHLWNLYLCVWFIGLSAGAWNNANNVWLIEMWQQKSAPVLQLSQFVYGIGTIIGPLIDRPYLTGVHAKNFNETEILNPTSPPLIDTILTTNENIDRRSKLKIPFFISGIITVTGSILMAIMFLVKRYRTPSEKPEKEQENPSIKLFDRKESPRYLIICLFSILMAFYLVSEVVILEFGASYYQLIPLKLSASKSAEIVSAMALAHSFGRGTSIFMAIKTKPQHMIAYHLFITCIGIITLILAQNSLTLLWIASLLISFGFSSMFPSTFAFIGQYLKITNEIGTILILFSASFNLFMPFILGTYIETHPIVFIMSIANNLLISILILLLIIYIIRKTETKFKNFLANSNELENS